MTPKYPWERIGNTPAKNEANRQSALHIWRDANPAGPDPDDDALAAWFAANERQMLREEWEEAHPGEPVPDDPQVIRRWAVNWRNEAAVERARERGETFH